MNDKKHIDRLFQEKLKDYEITPNNSVWENIESELNSRQKQKKGIPLWYKIAGFAASLLLLITIGNSFFNSNNDIPEENGVNTDSKNSIQNNLTTNKPLNSVDANDSETIANQKGIEVDSSSSTQELNNIANGSYSTSIKNTDNDSSTVIASNNESKKQRNNAIAPLNINKLSISKEGRIVAQNTVLSNDNQSAFESEEKQKNIIDNKQIHSTLNELYNDAKSTAFSNLNLKQDKTEDDSDIKPVEDYKLSLTETVANEEENIEALTEEEIDRWEAASNIAPVYFNSFGKGSSIHSQFNNNSKSGDINMSYGVSGSYALNNKLRIRTGINKVNLGYSTNDVVVFINVNSPNNPGLLRNVQFNEAGQNLSFISVEEFNFAQVPGVFNDFIKSSIDQKLGFIEVPLELEYNISNRKVDINLIGGFSALFLSNNEIYAVQNGNSTLLGKATNINNTSFSANFGLGLDFKISKQFNFNLDPLFKYQINTFNNTSGNFKPFFIGVYTGLKFKF
jgi:hypothetical protein